MASEDKTDIPDSWRRLVHPRRHGMIGLEPVRDDEEDAAGHFGQYVARGDGLAPEHERILGHSHLDDGLAELIRSGQPSVAADAVWLALAPVTEPGAFSWNWSLEPVDDLVTLRGLPHAAAAFVESSDYYLDRVSWSPQVLVLRRHSETVGTRAWGVWASAARHLRWMLAVAPQEVYDQAVAALTPLREGSLQQRIYAAYLMPDQREWVSEDLADLPDHYYLEGLLFYSAGTAEQFSGFGADRLEQFVTAYDALGHKAVPLIAHWLVTGGWSPQVRRDSLDVLTRIPTDAAFDALLGLLDVPDVAKGVLAAAQRFPRRAARMLAARREDDFIGVLFRRYVRAHQDAPEAALVTRAPDAMADALPPLLMSPPWTRKAPPRVIVSPSPLAAEPRIAWRDGEQDEWRYDWMDSFGEEMRKHVALADSGEAPAEFYISGPADIVRPRLAKWKSESAWMYLKNPQAIVAKYELDALEPVLRLARRKPAVGASLLMPYLAQGVADLMADWLIGSRQFRTVAQEWFTRHGADGAALLIPAALGVELARSRSAALALSRLDTGDVLAAADSLGCRAAVEALLARDPLDLVPERIPAVPKWADPALLPQILLPGRQVAVPQDATRTLLRMIAMSQLDAPYEGLRVIADDCDPRSLSDFAWSLYRLWEIEGRPSQQAWAMDCLGYFGDDTVADRFAPRVRAWPSEGSAPRAKRGADVLAAMGSDRALGHLSALARNAKSAPLRAHAAAALDRAAADRGLLPEQLDDLLAPDLGLDSDPVEYRGVSYSIDLGADGDLILREPSGEQITQLPKPSGDDEKAVRSAWNTRRRKAKPVIGDQTARLEEAMIVQRQWTSADFRSQIAAHPLLGRLGRRLVWVLGGQTVALDRLGDLVDPEGGLTDEAEWVRLAHPAIDDFAPWREWLKRLGTPQPFVQADREVFPAEDPSVHWQRTVGAAAFYRLLRQGWHWGPSGRQARRYQLFRPFGAEGRVVLTIEPGVSAVSDPKNEPAQTITELVFASSRSELGVFSDLPPVSRSELARSLRTLG